MHFSGFDRAQQLHHTRNILKPRGVKTVAICSIKTGIPLHPQVTTYRPSNSKLLLNTPMYTMAPSTIVSSAPGSDDKIADLTVISYEKLLRKDVTEAALLLSACAEWGFFYLDLGGGNGESYRQTVDKLFGVSKNYFAKPIEEKLKDTMDEDMEVFNICG